jgi:putative phosphoesterase
MLAIGDPHIPRRAKQIPELIMDKISELSSSRMFDYTFFTGDLIDYPEFLEFLASNTKKEVFTVMGNMDYYAGNRDAPLFEHLTIKLNKFKESLLKISITHGDQIQVRGNHHQLEDLAREHGSHILISGHTHQEEVFLTKTGTLLVNPGSVTGAWSFIASGIPSFIIISINTENYDIKTTLFQLDQKKREITQKNFYFLFQNNQIKEKYR